MGSGVSKPAKSSRCGYKVYGTKGLGFGLAANPPPKTSLRSESQHGIPLRQLYANLPKDAAAYRRSEQGRQAPITPPKTISSAAPATPPKESGAIPAESEEETWGKWQSPVVEPRAVMRLGCRVFKLYLE